VHSRAPSRTTSTRSRGARIASAFRHYWATTVRRKCGPNSPTASEPGCSRCRWDRRVSPGSGWQTACTTHSTGLPVVGKELEGDGSGRVESVLVDRKGTEVPYAAEAVVLATGGLVGKGIDSDREGVHEPVLGCHVPHPADRYEWFVDDAFGDHPYARFGVDPDDRLRPIDPDGEVQFPNVHVAGATLGGADVAREKSASGVSLATGVVAGREAAEVAR
jgi:anaerobic glycerol-3-phosphate dehydrogenase